MTTQVSSPQIVATLRAFDIGNFRFSFATHALSKKKQLKQLFLSALERTRAMLVSMGAQDILYPIVGSSSYKSSSCILDQFQHLPFSKLDLLSVHHMSSLSTGSRFIEEDGSVKGLPDVFVADASLLPSYVAESPQLTIMSFVSSFYRDHK